MRSLRRRATGSAGERLGGPRGAALRGARCRRLARRARRGGRARPAACAACARLPRLGRPGGSPASAAPPPLRHGPPALRRLRLRRGRPGARFLAVPAAASLSLDLASASRAVPERSVVRRRHRTQYERWLRRGASLRALALRRPALRSRHARHQLAHPALDLAPPAAGTSPAAAGVSTRVERLAVPARAPPAPPPPAAFSSAQQLRHPRVGGDARLRAAAASPCRRADPALRQLAPVLLQRASRAAAACELLVAEPQPLLQVADDVGVDHA